MNIVALSDDKRNMLDTHVVDQIATLGLRSAVNISVRKFVG